MKNQNGQIERLAEALASLVNFVPETSDDLDHWYDKAEYILEDRELLR